MSSRIYLQEDDPLINNTSGQLSLAETERGVWIVVEDNTDICSIGLDLGEIQALIDRLTKRLKKVQ